MSNLKAAYRAKKRKDLAALAGIERMNKLKVELDRQLAELGEPYSICFVRSEEWKDKQNHRFQKFKREIALILIEAADGMGEAPKTLEKRRLDCKPFTDEELKAILNAPIKLLFLRNLQKARKALVRFAFDGELLLEEEVEAILDRPLTDFVGALAADKRLEEDGANGQQAPAE